MQIRLANPNLQQDSIVDGEGIRAVLWTQGCPHNCKGCHNPETHAFDQGVMVDIEAVKVQIKALQNHDGITFSGGDPLCQVEECLEIAKYAKELGLNIWCYTGYTFEQLLLNPKCREFLNYIDVLVDGKFILEEKSLNLKFKGSKNQRIINVSRSLKEGKVCIVKKYSKEKTYKTMHETPQYMFI